MGRKPSNGAPSFRFNNSEIAEMESILQAHNIQVPGREVLAAIADKFSNTPERLGKVEVQIKQVWNWFQNRRYAVRAKLGHVKMHPARPIATTSGQGEANNAPENSLMEFEARSARDGAWYDVTCFLAHRSLETGDPQVLVRFAGFGHEEDEWVNVRKHIRQRSLPCESSECVAVLPGDLILCFQEGKEQALYFDAHVFDSQRRRHDARGCRCRFLVRYDHDQSEEIVPLRKICRRPDTDYRLRQLNAEAAKVYQQRAGTDTHSSNPGKGHAPTQVVGLSPSGNNSKVNPNSETPQPQHTTKAHVTDDHAATPTQTSLPQPHSVATQLLSAPVTQVPATPTQAEPIEREGLLKLTGSAETRASTVLKQMMPATEGHVVASSSTPDQISLHDPGESKELPTTEGQKVDLCAATPLSSLLEPGKSKELFETAQPQYSAETHPDTVVATLTVPTEKGPGAAVATSIPTQTSPSNACKSEVSLETTQPQLSADAQMLPATDGQGEASISATPTQVTLPRAGESEVPLETSPCKHSTELQEPVVGDRTLTQISLPEPNESEVLLETSQAPPHSEETPEDSVLVQMLSSTTAATPAQASHPQLTESNMPPGES